MNMTMQQYVNARMCRYYLIRKMRERRIKHDKYIIMLEENIPFGKDEQVKIMSKTDFEKLGEMKKSLKKKSIK